MAVIWLEGWQYRGGAAGLALEYTIGGGGTLAESTMPSRRTDCPAVSLPDVTIARAVTLSAGADVITGFAYEWPGGSSATATGPVCAILDDSGSPVTHVTLVVDNTSDATEGVLKLYRGDSGGTLLSATDYHLTAGQQAFIELRVKIHDSTGEVELQVNGTQVDVLTSQDTRNGGNATVGAVQVSGPVAGALLADWYIVDPSLATANATFLGPYVRVDTYLPINQAYSTREWTSSTDPNSQFIAAEIDDASPDGDTTYVRSASSGEALLAMEKITHAPASVVGVRHIVTAEYATATGRGLRFRDAAPLLKLVARGEMLPAFYVVDAVGKAWSISTSYETNSSIYTKGLIDQLDHVGDVTVGNEAYFTEAEFNAAQFGFRSERAP